MSAAPRIASAALLAVVLSHQPAAAGNCGERGHFLRGRQLTMLGITDDQQLIEFGECTPDRPRRDARRLSGLERADGRLLGIDFRVRDGALYGVGKAGGVYVIDTETAVASKVSQVQIALRGTAFGVDFDPVADRLRIVSNEGQNLLHDVDTGATEEDGDLHYLAGDPSIQVAAPGVVAAAHTNNDADPTTGTTLFVLDRALDQIAIQAPAGSGALTPTGALGLDTGRIVAFDIYTAVRAGAAGQNAAFAELQVDGLRGFYRIDLLAGRAVEIGPLVYSLDDLAIAPQR